MEQDSIQIPNEKEFSGNIFIFQAYDVGDDINLAAIQQFPTIHQVPLSLPKYFKNYHLPVAMELPDPHTSPRCISCKIHNFGAISLTYKIPFTSTLESVRKNFNDLARESDDQSLIDVKSVFKKIESCITNPKFYQTRASYMIMQVNPAPGIIDIAQLKKEYGSIIASTLRFELEGLSEAQKKEIIDSAIGYYRGDLIIIDTDAAFVYDDEYAEILDFFEFANIQQLELRYFDRLLDQQLNRIYEGKVKKIGFAAYLPFIGTLTPAPVDILSKLRVDISVIAERLEGSIKLAGEPYLSELYELLVKKLDIKNWHDAIDRKLNIIHDVQSVYQFKIDAIREDMLSTLIIVLIFIELIIGILHYLK